MKTPHKVIEEGAAELMDKNVEYIKTTNIGQYNESGVNIGFETAYNVIKKDIQVLCQKLVEVAREEERERIKAILQDMEAHQTNHPREYCYAVNDTLDMAIHKITPLPTNDSDRSLN